MPKYEKTLKSNPNQLTIHQHIIPRKHIAEWVGIDGKFVKVSQLLPTKKTKHLKPNSPYFCAMRLWDQATETRMLGGNERLYQQQITLLKLIGDISNHQHITEYYLMLIARIYVANKPRPDSESISGNLSYEPLKEELCVFSRERSLILTEADRLFSSMPITPQCHFAAQ